MSSRSAGAEPGLLRHLVHQSPASSPAGRLGAGSGCGSRSSAGRSRLRPRSRLLDRRPRPPRGQADDVLRRGVAQGGGAAAVTHERPRQDRAGETSLRAHVRTPSPKRTRTSTRSCSSRSRRPSLAPARARTWGRTEAATHQPSPRVRDRGPEEEGRPGGLLAGQDDGVAPDLEARGEAGGQEPARGRVHLERRLLSVSARRTSTFGLRHEVEGAQQSTHPLVEDQLALESRPRTGRRSAPRRARRRRGRPPGR